MINNGLNSNRQIVGYFLLKTKFCESASTCGYQSCYEATVSGDTASALLYSNDSANNRQITYAVRSLFAACNDMFIVNLSPPMAPFDSAIDLTFTEDTSIAQKSLSVTIKQEELATVSSEDISLNFQVLKTDDAA